MNEPRSEDSVLQRSPLDFLVVGIGASAGGIGALRRLLEQMPSEPDMALVVVLHLSPRHESSAVEILQSATRMSVQQVENSVSIERNKVYVIPPTQDLRMTDGKLFLSDAVRPVGRHVVIDGFFRTLAEAHRDRSVGVVLSGTGSDGSIGIGWLKQNGGVVIAQSPADAEHDGMPLAAIATGHVDIVLPAPDIPQRLLQIWANAKRIEMPDAAVADLKALEPSSPQAAEAALQDIMAMVRKRTGHDFKHYKRATMLRRIERRLQVCGVPTLPSYRDFLASHLDETQALQSDLLIGVTQFFRDRPAFEALERDVLPALFADAREREQVRVWVAGVSTGEEAYSISMLLAEEAQRVDASAKTTVFATDIDERAIGKAREGRYPEAIVGDVTPTRLRHYFHKEEGGYRIAKTQRDTVVFALHNVLRDPPFSRLDLVTCRNLLIYLDRAAQHDVLQLFHFSLRPGGYLFLGNSETVDAADELFSVVDKAHRIYRAKPVSRSLHGLLHFNKHASLQESPVALATTPPRAFKLAELHQHILGEIGPASLVLTTSNEIVHASSRAADYMRFVEGAPTNDVVACVRPELRPALRVCLFEALQSEHAESPLVPIERDGRRKRVRMSARVGKVASVQGHMILLTFDELDGPPAATPGDGDGSQPAFAQLEGELLRRTEQLQTTVEQLETSTEELKAGNEELQAINEELRAATEELETSKEELQSTNEELVTVNAELKVKVEQMGVVNDDLTNLIAVTDIATVFVDEQMRIKRFTPSAAGIFSLRPSDIGRALFDFTNRLEYPALAEDAQTVFKTLRGLERRVKSDDGRSFLARLLPYRTSGHKISGVVLTFIDVSSQLVERGMARGDGEAMQLVADTMTEYAIVRLDAEGQIKGFSAGAEAVLGWAEEEVVGAPLSVLFTPEDQAAGVLAAELQTALRDGRALDERWHLRKDGERVFLSGVLKPFAEGGIGGFVKIARDMTHDRAASEIQAVQLRTAERGRDSAVADMTMKGEFLAVMSHELKHPLNLININAELLTKLPEALANDRLMRAAQTIQRTVKGQARVIDDLLDLSRTSTGKLQLNVAPLLVADAIAPAVQSADAEARGRDIQFTTTGMELPLLIDGDPVRIEQVAWNLLSNALKFTRTGGSIAARLRTDDGFAVLEVQDTGRGIASDFLPHVFDMFRQDEAVTRRQEGGLGIGLALVKSLVELHGGSVSAESEGAGRGATFRIRLPLRDRTDFAPLSEAQPGRGRLTGMRILVVDDTQDTLDTFGYLLAGDGAVVTTAASARQALEAADHGDFDLIISDIGMPGMDGYELIAELRSRARTAAVPAIALTGFGRPQDVKRALTAGFNAHLDKPVDFDAMYRQFERLRLQKS